ncbi:MAG: CbiX/SirB N-terminal domain-containing protein [Proteobacteria bacterium]|nr:CbiX/SirB N-terminal domain-containing protein [Burkholderiales bacterium]
MSQEDCIARVYSSHAPACSPYRDVCARTMTAEPLVLFAHGARDARWAEPFEAIRTALQAQQPTRRIELAFLEFMQPSLDEVAAALHADGVERALVVPLFLATGGHLRRDLPAMVEAIGVRFPGLEFRIEAPLGESPAMRRAIVDWLAGM